MFPLGSVLFPLAVLPLHVFEPRYVALVERILLGDLPPEFGTVLIERGSEVGGGDVRFDVGTVMRVGSMARVPPDRYVLETVGVERVRVVEWLPDAPFPRARVEARLDHVGPDAVGARDAAEFALRQFLAFAADLGVAVDPDVPIGDDPARASFEIAAFAPVSALDAQAVLELDDVGQRCWRLAQLIDEQRELAEAQRASDRGDPPDD